MKGNMFWFFWGVRQIKKDQMIYGIKGYKVNVSNSKTDSIPRSHSFHPSASVCSSCVPTQSKIYLWFWEIKKGGTESGKYMKF